MPSPQGEIDDLLKPLQPLAWVAAQTGIASWKIAANEQTSRMEFPSSIDGRGRMDFRYRSERWIPAQIDAHIRKTQIPILSDGCLLLRP